jgi:transcription elongation GreA/GreB family factor
MRRHVVRTFKRVSEERITIRNEASEERDEVTLHIGISVLLNDERRRCVAAVSSDLSCIYAAFLNERSRSIGDLVETFTACCDGDFLLLLPHENLLLVLFAPASFIVWSMSRAFVKEPDGLEAFDELPERLVSDNPNLVTEEGMKQIEDEVERLSRAYAEAQAAGDRAALNVAARDLRYWTARLASAELVSVASDGKEVRFGSRVTIERNDGRQQTYRIVGEDEADPTKGTLSYVSPLGRALLGKTVGETARVGAGEVEIILIG